MTEAPEEHPEPPPIQQEYADRDFSRPPFKFPTRDGSYQEGQALYPQVDRFEEFEMGYRVFTVEKFPAPPDHLPADHPVRNAYTQLLHARNELENNMSGIRNIEPYYRGDRESAELVVMTQAVREHVGFSEPLPARRVDELKGTLARKERERHLELKKRYFQWAIAYVLLYKNCPEIGNRQEINDLLDEIEAYYLAHIAYVVARNAIHLNKRDRKDGTPVIDHPEAVSFHAINRYMALIKACKNPIQRHWLYHEMKLDIIDYLEDLTHLSPEFLTIKLIQHTHFDTTVEDPLQKPEYKGIPKNTNFCFKNATRILKELKTLIKPSAEKRDGYLRRQILKGKLPRRSKIPTFLTKLADRLHNLHTLDTENILIKDQAETVLFTTDDIIHTGLEAHGDPEFTKNRLKSVLLQELHTVASAAMREADRLLDLDDPELEVRGLTKALVNARRRLTGQMTEITKKTT